MNKLWMVVATQNQEKNINELTEKIWEFFDGIVGVVNQPSNDLTYDILESRKKGGTIIKRPFVKNHGHFMNEALLCGTIQNGDWIFIIDSPQRINIEWLKNMRNSLDLFEKHGFNAVFLDRIYLARYFDDMLFQGGIHWGLTNIRHKIFDFPSQIYKYNQENYIINKRDKLTSGFLNPAKYYYSYGDAGQTQILYSQFSEDHFKHHEKARQLFRIFCQYNLGLDLTLDSLIKYMQDNVGNYPEYFEQILELEVNLKDIFRLKVLNQPWEDLAKQRFDWSYFYWKNTGEIIQDQSKTNYRGAFNIYKIEKGESPE